MPAEYNERRWFHKTLQGGFLNGENKILPDDVTDKNAMDPNLVDGKYSIKDLVDVDHLRRVFEKFSELTGFTTGFLAYPSMEILISTGWRDICTKFHRACPASACHCKTSNVKLFKNSRESRQTSIQKCENGMFDGAIPIIVRDKCIAFLATGQALFSEPDEERFKNQARTYGFDENSYMDALRKVPIVSEIQFRKVMDFLSEIAVILAERGLKNLEIHENVEKFKAIANYTVGWESWFGPDGRYVWVNPGVEHITGYSPEEIMAMPDFISTIVAEEDRIRFVVSFQDALRGGKGENFEFRYLHKNGAKLWLSASWQQIFDAKGNTLGVRSSGSDITERKRMEDALRVSELWYRELVNLAVDGILVGSHDGVITEANECMCTMTGMTREELVGRHISFLFPSGVLDKTPLRFDLLQKGETVVNERKIVRPDSSAIVVEMRTKMMPDFSYQSIYRDITHRKKAEEALRESQELLSMFIRKSPIYAFIKEVTPDGSRILQISDNYLQMLGIPGSDMLGKKMDELFPADMATKMTEDDWSVVKNGKILKLDEDFNGHSYTSIKFPIAQGAKTLLAGYTIDITDHKKAEAERERIDEQLRQSQKMEAIGNLAGGIAHDFNNQLMGIMGYAELLYNRLDDPSLRNDIECIIRAARRSSDLTRDLLAFSRKGKFMMVPVNVNKIIEEVISLLEHSIDKRIEIKRSLNASPVMITGDPSQIQNALLNLGINAKDALPSGGEIVFTTENARMEDVFITAEERRNAIKGNYVKISVIDDGIGMDEDTKKHLFEPFFTTKQPGKGTGMGLASVYGTVKNHNGVIYLDSKLGEGSVFSIFFPLVEDNTDFETPEPMTEQRGVKSNILLVDDEEVVRTIISRILRSLGHTVVTCNDGMDAVEYYRQSWKETDLVILDMMMPIMNGKDAFFEMQAINKDIKALLISGFSIEGEAQSLLDAGMKGFIQKPFNMSALAKTVEKTLS
jgi:PAS domain S-box-containing protein